MCRTQSQLYPTPMKTVRAKISSYASSPFAKTKTRKRRHATFLAVSFIFFISSAIFQHLNALSLSALFQYDEAVSLDELSISRALEENHRIPHHIVLLDSRYDSFFDVPSPLQENIQNTVETYIDFWEDATEIASTNSHHDKIKAMVESPYVWYLNNTECENAIGSVASDLLPFYRSETRGQNKANICRVAALYLRGGYYFDTDMQIVKALPIENHITFVSPWEKPHKKYKGLFNSFIAIAPKHPMLKINIDLMRDFYIKKKTKFHLLGTGSLYKSYIKFYNLTDQEATDMRDGNLILSDDESLKKYSAVSLLKPTGHSKEWPSKMLLGEIHLSEEKYADLYADFPRHDNTRKDRCGYVVHDFIEKEIYFYSRTSGVPSCRLLYKIPRRAIFIDPSLETLKNLPQFLKLNVMHTAQVYSNFWDTTFNISNEDEKEKKVDYMQLFQDKGAFLGDKECRDIVAKVEPSLLWHYMGEQRIEQKRKLCRLSYLYDKGGYYFDTDIQVISPVLPENEMISYIQPLAKLSSNSSSHETIGLLDSFLAVAAKHPLIKIQLNNLVNYYRNREASNGVDSDSEEKIVMTHRGLEIQGEKSLIRAIKDFYDRDRKGINTENWGLDFSLQEMEVELEGDKRRRDVIGKNLKEIFFYSNTQ